MDFDDFDLGPQSDEQFEADYDVVYDGWGDDYADEYLSQYDDDPNPYDGTYSEE